MTLFFIKYDMKWKWRNWHGHSFSSSVFWVIEDVFTKLYLHNWFLKKKKISVFVHKYVLGWGNKLGCVIFFLGRLMCICDCKGWKVGLYHTRAIWGYSCLEENHKWTSGNCWWCPQGKPINTLLQWLDILKNYWDDKILYEKLRFLK